MIQRGGGAGFLLEAPQAVGVFRVGGRENLDRDLAPEPFIARGVDLAHSALAEHGRGYGTGRRCRRVPGPSVEEEPWF